MALEQCATAGWWDQAAPLFVLFGQTYDDGVHSAGPTLLHCCTAADVQEAAEAQVSKGQAQNEQLEQAVVERRGLQSEVERLRDTVAMREASIAELHFTMEVTKQQHGAYRHQR